MTTHELIQKAEAEIEHLVAREQKALDTVLAQIRTFNEAVAEEAMKGGETPADLPDELADPHRHALHALANARRAAFAKVCASKLRPELVRHWAAFSEAYADAAAKGEDGNRLTWEVQRLATANHGTPPPVFVGENKPELRQLWSWAAMNGLDPRPVAVTPRVQPRPLTLTEMIRRALGVGA